MLTSGMDVGEQDGRFVGSYALQIPRRDAPREEQYMFFWLHFDRMSLDLRDQYSVLTSLYMPHYLLKVRVALIRVLLMPQTCSRHCTERVW